MARCQCAGSSCGCSITAGAGVNVEGVGSADRPYVITATPNVYSVPITPASPAFLVNAQFVSEVEARALFLLEIADAVTALVNLPNGSSAQPYPVPGAVIEVIARGTIGSSGVTFAGATVTWFGPAPTTTTLGLYRFIWTGESFAGTWTPYR